MTRRDLRPYFLWDEDVSIGELQEILAGPDSPRRDELLGKMLREARDIDVWPFVRPTEVADALELPAGVPPAELRAYLGELIRRLLVLAAPEEPGRT